MADATEAADYQALEIAASRALAAGDFRAAFASADRRCRIPPPPEGHSFVLRAEAAFRLGDRRGAIADLMHALELAPNDPIANRRILSWATGARQEQAADALLAIERDAIVLRDAIAILRQRGRTSFAAITVHDNSVSGWVAWLGRKTIELAITTADRTASVTIEADPFHPLSSRSVDAASFRVRRPAIVRRAVHRHLG